MRCDMEKLISTITSEKLEKKTEVTFALIGNLPDCMRINTHDYIKVMDAENVTVETALPFNRFDKPIDKMQCGDANPCANTGTLALEDKDNYAVFKVPYDSTKFSDGIVTFYVKGFTGAKDVNFKISDTAGFTNSDVYTTSVTGVDGEFSLVIIDLSALPTSTEGTGWTADGAAYIAINVDSDDALISTIAIFESIADFENNDVVKMRCLTTIEGDDAIDAAEATCAYPNVKHDVSSPTFERTITGSMVTENYQMLNPLIGKGDSTTGFDIHSKEYTIIASGSEPIVGEAIVGDATLAENGEYGVVVLPDAYQDECGFITVDAGCELLRRYDIPAFVAVDEGHFFAIPQTDGSTKLYFNKGLVGRSVTVSYPRKKTVTELIADIDNVDGVRVEMFVPYKLSNGKKRAKVYKNVLVTSFSDPRGEDDTEFSVTVSIQKDSSGHYYHIYDYE